jgi:uncharacterized protein (DUF39 family)
MYLGATELGEDLDISHGGAHVIEDLLKGKDIDLDAIGFPTDCYPARKLKVSVRLEDLNQVVMFNPRNGYQNYAVAVNSSSRELHTYMGRLRPFMGNVAYSSSGQLNPLLNDPYLETIGVGTSIFLGGAQGSIVWEGTQSSKLVERNDNGVPKVPAGTLGVIGDLKKMSPKYIRAVSIEGYGTSLAVGLGVPIPILNENVLLRTCVRDREIKVKIFDYGVRSRDRPCVGEIDYETLRSGEVKLDGEPVPSTTYSSYTKAREIALELKKGIEKGEFQITEPARKLSPPASVKTLNGGVVDGPG